MFLALTWDDELAVPRPDSVQWEELSDPKVEAFVETASSTDWRALDDTPWIQVRPGTKEVNDGTITRTIYGIWIAVDTALGTSDRGYLVELSEENGEAAPKPGTGAPYVASDVSDLPEQAQVALNAALDLPDGFPDLTLEIDWVEAAGNPIPVDLVVDFGNTRTVVLAVERIQDTQGFTPICRPIFFPGSEWDSTDTDYLNVDLSRAIPDSWFMLVEPVFTEAPLMDVAIDPQPQRQLFGRRKKEAGGASRTARVSHSFKSLSPALIGAVAREQLSGVNVDHGGLSFLSSPKRYIWDDEATGRDGSTVWTMNPQPWRSKQARKRRLTPLDGELLRFTPRTGEQWSVETDEGEEVRVSVPAPENVADHARSEALTWVALSILEHAHAQIQSERWREGNRPFLPRKLGDILLTYPAGWTESEVRAFENRWKTARDVFIASREDDAVSALRAGTAPQVKPDLDEAVAPQLVLVFSEIHHLRDYGRNWIDLYGRRDGDRTTIRIMTIDIGGGTTDTSIIEYVDEQEGVGVDLSATLLFKDSHNTAGDRLVKDIIECVLLPALGARFADDDDQRDAFEDLFFAKALREAERAQWSVITRTVLIPIVHAMLAELIAADGKGRDPFTNPIIPKDAGASASQIAKLNRLAATFDIDDPVIEFEEPIEIDAEAMSATIQAWLSDLADIFARYCAIFDCDLVMLTGKPSELPDVRTLLEYRLPIAPNRLMSMRGYYAGGWLPLTRDGRIPDAKVVTALGAAIHQGITTGMIAGWRVRGVLNEPFRVHNYWGRMSGDAKPFTDGDVLLKPNDYEVTVEILSDTYIGRAVFLTHVLPDQIYHLRLKGSAAGTQRRRLEVTLERIVSAQNGTAYAMSGESLALVDAVDLETGKRLGPDQVELRLCTLPRGEAYWQDMGRFEVRWDGGQD